MTDTPKKDGSVMEPPVRDEKGRIVSGVLNPAGKPKGAKHLTTKLFAALEETTKGGGTYSDLLVKRILKDAIEKGSPSMIHLLMNYIDGAPLQGIDLTTNGESMNNRSESAQYIMDVASRVSKELKDKKTK